MEHVIISCKTGAMEYSPRQPGPCIHTAEFRDGTFHAVCGADKRMDTPVLARYTDLDWGFRCSYCTKWG